MCYGVILLREAESQASMFFARSIHSIEEAYVQFILAWVSDSPFTTGILQIPHIN
jgi:hypothetical protein